MPILLFAVSLALTQAGPQQRPVTASDYYRLTSVSTPAMAPSGRFVAMTVTTVLEEKDRRHTEVWLAPVDGSAPPYRLTAPGSDAADPVWSPDGSVIGFSSRREGSEPDDPSIWFLRMTALGGEAFQITGVNGAPEWSPDGQSIAYLWGGKQPDTVRNNRRWGWVSPSAITRGADPKRFDGRVVTSTRYKGDGRGFLPDPATVPPRHIHVVSSAGGDARLLTPGTFSQSEIAWSPDGRQIAFVQDSTEWDELREDSRPEIYLVDVSSGAIRQLTTGTGQDRSPGFSPDGRTIAYTCSAGRGKQTDICTIPASGGTPRNLTAQWNLAPGAPRWSPDGRSLSFQAEVEGSVHLFRVAAQGGTVAQVTRGLRQLGGFSASADGRVMAYTGSEITRPSELYASAVDGSGERRLTSFNDAYLASVATIPADTFWYTSVGGLRVQGWLMQPYGYEAGRRYPLVLSIHGGPHGQYGNVYFHEFQMLAGQGYWMLFTNPRGSTGYGHDFTFATRGRWGMEDYQDLMKSVDEVIRRTRQVDTTRMAVLGGSYGGFMTNWIVGQTNRFAVAETDRSIFNWYSWYGSSDAQGLTEYEFFGPPWENDSLYRALSPMTFGRNIRTPMLIVHSEEDHRTPITDAEQLFMLLKKRGIPAEFVRYPRSSHGLSRAGPPWLLVDRLERIRTWFAHWIGTGTTPGAAAASGSR